MPLQPVLFHSLNDLSSALRKILPYTSKKNYFGSAVSRCVVAVDGNTYLIEDIQGISDCDAETSPLTFPTKEGSKLTLLQVKHAFIKKDKNILRGLVYNAPLVQLLEKIHPFDLYNTPLPISVLNKSFPILFPMITVYQNSFDRFDIEKWMNFQKKNQQQPHVPGHPEHLLDKDKMYSNKALEELIWFCYRQTELDYANLRSQNHSELTREEITHLKKVDKVVKRKREVIQDRLIDAQIHVEANLKAVHNLTKVQEASAKDSEHSDFVKSLNGKNKEEIKAVIQELELERQSLIKKRGWMKTAMAIGTTLSFSAAIFSLLPLSLLLGPAGILFALVPLVIGIGFIVLGKRYLQKNNAAVGQVYERAAICEVQMRINSYAKVQQKRNLIDAKLQEIAEYKKQTKVMFNVKEKNADGVVPTLKRTNMVLFNKKNRMLNTANSESSKELTCKKLRKIG